MVVEYLTEIVLLLYASVYLFLVRRRLPVIPAPSVPHQLDQRSKFLDFAKGSAILGVLAMHIHLVFNTGPIYYNFDRIFRYAIPFFFIVSGAVTTLPSLSSNTLKQFYKRRLVRIVIPYIIFSLIATYLTKNFLSPFHYFLIALTDIFSGNAILPYYFIPVLIQFYLIYPFLWYLLYQKRLPPMALLGTALSINFLSFLSLSTFNFPFPVPFTSYLFFFVFGMIFRSLFLSDDRTFLKRIHLPLWTATVILFTFLFAQIDPDESFYNIKFVYGTTLFIFFFAIFPKLEQFPLLKKIVQIFGKNSFYVYLVHFLVILLLPPIMPFIPNIPLLAAFLLVPPLSLFLAIGCKNAFEGYLFPNIKKTLILPIATVFVFSIPFSSIAAPAPTENPWKGMENHYLKLEKPEGMPSVPTTDGTVPITPKHEAIAQQLNETFRLERFSLRGEKKTYPLSLLTGGKFVFGKNQTLVFNGNTLPNAKIQIKITNGAETEIFHGIADSLGLWHIEIPLTNTKLGKQELNGSTSIGSISTEENFFGTFSLTNIAPPENNLDDLMYDIQSDAAITHTTENITAPTLATIALLNTTASVPIMGFLPYLAYLFSEPFGILFRKRNRGWGIVYNSITKQPIDLAVVRLIDKDGKLVQTRVTDTHGRYNFVVDPGEYSIVVQKDEYFFPSQILRDKKGDAKYSNLYFGEILDIGKDEKMVVHYNIPLDIAPNAKKNIHVILASLLQEAQRSIALIGPTFALISFVLRPTLLFFFLILLHLFLYVLFRRFTYSPAIKTYGSILDRETGFPLGHVIVKLFDVQYNKLLDTKVTNSKGQYNFLVGENDYFVSAEKNGYRPMKTEVITVKHEGSGIISRDLVMERG
jgi:peptidoglycan/LPS O-acetylase OafA/YrhL/5-hydroxyisourate hydrolase-like protein (transthyretin family)